MSVMDALLGRSQKYPLRMRKVLRQQRKMSSNITRSAVALSLGGAVVDRIPGQVATSGGQGLQSAASLYPTIGTVAGGFGVLRVLQTLRPENSRRKKARFEPRLL